MGGEQGRTQTERERDSIHFHRRRPVTISSSSSRSSSRRRWWCWWWVRDRRTLSNLNGTLCPDELPVITFPSPVCGPSSWVATLGHDGGEEIRKRWLVNGYADAKTYGINQVLDKKASPTSTVVGKRWRRRRWLGTLANGRRHEPLRIC